MARAELEQVCGRLRAPRRVTPARVVVVASVPPLRADARWTVRELGTGRPLEIDGEALAARAAAVGGRAAAREAGCDERTVRRAVLDGEHGVRQNPLLIASATGCAAPHVHPAAPAPERLAPLCSPADAYDADGPQWVEYAAP